MKLKKSFRIIISLLIILSCCSWGFLIHRTVNQLAVYQLPEQMRFFFYKNRDLLVKEAPGPDMRRNTDPLEAPRHFIDLEAYGDSAGCLSRSEGHAGIRRGVQSL